MKTIVRCLLMLGMLIVVAAPAYSVEVKHISICEMNEGTTEDQVDAMAGAKLKALRQMPGGEAAKVQVFWPVAVSNTGNIDFWVVVTFPSSADFGKFWDAYQDASPAARADDLLEGKVECPDSMLWEAHDTAAN